MRILVALVIFVLVSCGGVHSTQSKKRAEALVNNNFTELESGDLIRPFVVIVDDIKLTATELGIESNKTSFVTKRAFYNAFGKWDNVLYDSGDKHPILVWEAVQFPDFKDQNYTVYADSIEDFGLLLGSLVIMDSNGNDVIKNQQDRTVFRKMILKMIKRGATNKEFYKEYWTLVDPKVGASIEIN